MNDFKEYCKDERDHEWVVFSTAVKDGYLCVECINCDTGGFVEDPSLEEWTRAYNAPSQPYGWFENNRVTKQVHFESSHRHIERNMGL